MEAKIKDTVKNIFKANAFEAALELTENLRGEYIAEYGVKSWNALVAYYRKASLKQEVAMVAEPEPAYATSAKDEACENDNANSGEKDADVAMMNITPENVGELHNTLAGLFGEGPEPTGKEAAPKVKKSALKEEFEHKADEIRKSLEDKTGEVSFEKLMEALIELQDEYLKKYGVKLGKDYRKDLEVYRKAENKSVAKTPMMKQYEEMKKKHPDAILLFRVGDFYETFGEDAITASEILGITLTRRANGSAATIELTGFPHHALDTYLPKLVRAGKRVAICEQLEDPKKVKVKEVSAAAKPTNMPDDEKKDVVKTEPDAVKDPEEKDEERVEYMLYRNTGDKVEWFGHRENFYGLKVGDTARMIRMNNKGVSEGLVVASNALTLDQVALFHRCYGVIIRMKRSYKEQLELASECLNKLPDATANGKSLPSNDIKLTDYVLNFGK